MNTASIPVRHGKSSIAANLIWYGDFAPQPHNNKGMGMASAAQIEQALTTGDIAALTAMSDGNDVNGRELFLTWSAQMTDEDWLYLLLFLVFSKFKAPSQSNSTSEGA